MKGVIERIVRQRCCDEFWPTGGGSRLTLCWSRDLPWRRLGSWTRSRHFVTVQTRETTTEQDADFICPGPQTKIFSHHSYVYRIINKHCHNDNYLFQGTWETWVVYNTHKNPDLDLTGPQGFNEFIQLAADVVYRRLASGSSRTFLAFT